MKKAVFLTVFVIVCLIQPFYPARGQGEPATNKPPTIQQLNAAIVRMQGQLDAISATIKYLQDRQKVILSDGQQIKDAIKQAMDEKSLIDAAKDSVAGSGKDK